MSKNLQRSTKAAERVIRILRESKLKQGFPFLINSNELPSSKFYLEHPDGSITLACIDKEIYDFRVIKTLTASEEWALRKRYKLFRLK